MNRGDEIAQVRYKSLQRGFAAGFKAGQRTKGDHEAPRRWRTAWAHYLRQIHLLPGRHAPD